MTLPTAIPNALEGMGLSNGGSISNFNPANLKLELSQSYPAIFYGHDNILSEWHIWNCDGYNENTYSSYNCDTHRCDIMIYTHYYMNWGWNGGANGWYAAGVYTPSGSSNNYSSGLKMISGIRP
ncbi:C10 family peptidase [Algoriphagus sp. AGSA1]|uniref:C10 family peptidase n=1 Tax=Algoriphagus sp. AGSA1 TaxID=2907213 RepID=UPI001F47764A|nr:C10 family peptidase [Algoriphagus sp. AGSA1]MCE7053103.1 C10 family peptidase [Algoriphagus sp. AGSA1]